jgi:polysaccharide export outer membrane protein
MSEHAPQGLAEQDRSRRNARSMRRYIHRTLTFGTAFWGLCIASTIAACSPTPRYAPLPPPPAPRVTEEEAEYRLKPGDTLQIQFYYQPELGTTQEIRQDGRISLALLGEREVSGLTANELARQLAEEYGQYVDRIEVAVIVTKIAPEMVYVSGAVPLNQVIKYEGSLTVSQAIIGSGGFSPAAKLDSVLVIRDQGTTEPKIYKIDVREAVRKGGRDFLLQNRDVVYIPTTTITKVNQFVNQYIDGIIPKHVATAFGFAYPLRGVSGEVNFNINAPEK